MASGFVLLPLLVMFLNDEELGLWYVYIAVANLALLFEFGFNPTFARNIVFVVSGARRLTAEGRDESSVAEGIDWHLLNVVIRASKLVYAGIAAVVLLALVFGGSAYVAYIARDIEGVGLWISWSLFIVAIVLNLYFLYSITILRGYGDIAGENRAKTFAKVAQLLISGILLVCGAGLIGASIGYLANSVLMRMFALIRLRKHKEIQAGRASDATPVSMDEIKSVLGTVGHLAWRDGIVQLALYASTQAMSILSSLYLGLAETGTYSVLLQLSTAVYHFACAYPKSFYPAMQAAFAAGEKERQNRIVSSGVVAYWFLIVFGTAGVCVVILPLLPLFKSDFHVDYLLFLGMTLYLSLLQQHSIFCNYIISMNEIPYMMGYLVAAVLGLGFVYVFCALLGWGAWGIVAGQALSQIVYNNWKWPVYLCRKIGTKYSALLSTGATYWYEKLFSKGKTTRSKS